jgi:uncharacterized protein (TIGR00730 family)
MSTLQNNTPVVGDYLKGNICVFAGSSFGAKDEYIQAARELGRLLVERQYGLVYGGGNVGLMAVIANTVLDLGGHVVGVIPEFFIDKELAHRGVSDLRIVRSMHERKALMAELSDAFIALPGGIGTMEEFFEVLSWTQLKLQDKPCGLLNAENYYSYIVRFLDYAVQEKFLKPAHRELLIVENSCEALLDRLTQKIPSPVESRFERAKT